MALGIYLPISERAKDYDCFSMLLQLGNSISDYNKYFDKAWSIGSWDLALLLTTLTADVYQGIEAGFVCVDQLNYSKQTEWLTLFEETTTTDTTDFWTNEAFSLAEAIPRADIVTQVEQRKSSYTSDNLVYRLSYNLLKIFMDVVATVKETKSNYYYFLMGKHTMKFLATVFMIIDEAFNLNLLNPAKPWIRYANLGE
jgi:hypothetical protein